MGAFEASAFGKLSRAAEANARRQPSEYAMPAQTVIEMERYGIDSGLIERLFGPKSKIATLANKNESLDQEKTERGLRILRIVDLAERVFDSKAKALMWLERDNSQLRAKPIDLLVRESGANFVEQALLRIEYSVIG